ncbi:magnesium transporter NIPA-domain-containing protein [Amanita rubescens]|nr:magnesium transporter NIPA-domain-containing protein [Amanita rubescens]
MGSTVLPLLTPATLTGILIAICGNVLISFALNLQKLAHKRIHSPIDDDEDDHTPLLRPHEESRYLKSKLWWAGFLLMNIGEAGNFISYAYAPASAVAPLGTFALMSNCIFAPCMLGEQFKNRDLLGIALAIIGAVTVVLASNGSESQMDPETLIHAVTKLPFIVYSAIYAGGASVLATLSHGKVGQTWVFVDVGLCALFGGFTVLSTKAISTLLATKWLNIFTQWITYPVLFVLVATGVGQIKYLNRALMRFDSKVVVPTQFVLFTLSAIIGSAILYGDFEKATFHQTVAFLYGVATTFVGVFVIAWAPNNRENDEESVNGTDTPRITSPESIGRRRGGALISNGGRDIPSLQTTTSSLNIIGLSPAKHLLLVNAHAQDRRDDSVSDYDVDASRERYSHAANTWEGRRRKASMPRTGTSSIRDGSISREELAFM